MNLTAMLAAVTSDVRRPDKADLISRAVKAMVNKAHAIDYFPRDLLEPAVVTIGSAGDDVTFALPTRWRKFGYIFQTNAAGVIADGHKGFTNVEPSDQFTWDTTKKNEIYYVVGSNVRAINYASTISYVRYGYYPYQDLSAGSAETWMMANEMISFAITDMSCRYIHMSLGDATMARAEELNWAEWKQTILQEALVSSI